ncbi:pyridoxal phosphate-dependent aminotransferase [Methanoplanus sp. FWC-SCC4]|uniref:Pyridoxal phosphate-dependent aminotransferase n=1 Tax=Methanochimaera problematica TaxID=2609417 RepID=A0AA97FEV2_9EURY|nr:pyridoxal phosphate-dependent aminotransferase [Methanoplanus sp. FWC-SCC4]WOF16146.1 pyridoxal phosphate-dependent aminotransferase [Methanoplanus sp. FWC-SCC4]
MDRNVYSERVLGIEMSGIRKFFQKAKPDSINLGIGQPDFPTPLHIKQAGIRAIEDNLTGYTFNSGVPELRQALSNKFKNENGLNYTPDQIIVTAGAGEALHIAMQTLVDNGDRVLYQDPGFVSYRECAVLAGGKPEGIKLDETLHIDVEACKEQMDGAKVLVLNSPGNPTGAVESEETIKAISEYAEDMGVSIISDEVYEHFVYDKSHYSAANYSDDVLTINAASKTFSMTGWRIGFIGGPEDCIEQCLKVHQYCQTCATSISQYAAIAAYTGSMDCVMEMRNEYAKRRELLYNGLKNLGFEFPKPEGAFYMFVPMSGEIFAKIIDAGVVAIPGDAFGNNAKDYVRFSYAASEDNINEALKRIESAI